MWQDEGEGTGGVCGACGELLLWGGMSWVPHTEKEHQATAQRLKDAMRWHLMARIARKAGHKGTIRFTATASWFECSCGHTGTVWWVMPGIPDTSTRARYEGTVHLYGEGVRAQVENEHGPEDGKCRHCHHRWHGWLLCGTFFDYSTCRCRGVERR